MKLVSRRIAQPCGSLRKSESTVSVMIVCFDIGGSAIKCGLRPYAGRHPAPRPACRRRSMISTPLPTAIARADRRTLAQPPAPASPCPSPASSTPIPAASNAPIFPASTGALLPPISPPAWAGPCSSPMMPTALRLPKRSPAPGRGHRVVFGAILGTGVGGGLVIDGKLLDRRGRLCRRMGPWPGRRDLCRHAARRHSAFSLRLRPGRVRRYHRGARGIERLHRHLHGIDLSSTEIVRRMGGWRHSGRPHRRLFRRSASPAPLPWCSMWWAPPSCRWAGACPTRPG